jgi:predicted metal-dependent HD superfamily phosphohydrolase
VPILGGAPAIQLPFAATEIRAPEISTEGLWQAGGEWSKALIDTVSGFWGGSQSPNRSVTATSATAPASHPLNPPSEGPVAIDVRDGAVEEASPVLESEKKRGKGVPVSRPEQHVPEKIVKLVAPSTGNEAAVDLDAWNGLEKKSDLEKYLKSFGPEYSEIDISQWRYDADGNRITIQSQKPIEQYLQSLPSSFAQGIGISNPTSYSPVTEPNIGKGDFLQNIAQVMDDEGTLGSFAWRFTGDGEDTWTIGPNKFAHYLKGDPSALYRALKQRGMQRAHMVSFEAFPNNVKRTVEGAKSRTLDEIFKAIGYDPSQWQGPAPENIELWSKHGSFLPPQRIDKIYAVYDELVPKPDGVLPGWAKERILIGKIYAAIRQAGYELFTFQDTHEMVKKMLEYNDLDRSKQEGPGARRRAKSILALNQESMPKLSVSQAFDAYLLTAANNGNGYKEAAATILGLSLDSKTDPADKLPETVHTLEEDLAFLKERWTALLQRHGVSPAAISGQYDFLMEQYSDDSRAYHTPSHVRRMLELSDVVRNHREFRGKVDWDGLEYAIIFHDGIYKVGAKDNEAESEKMARYSAEVAGLPPDFIERMSEYIMATTHDKPPGSLGAKLMADLDLSSFAVPSGYYFRYGNQVSNEMTQVVPEEKHLVGSLKFMEHLTGRPRIFYTHYFYDRYEDQARANMEKSKLLINKTLHGSPPSGAWDPRKMKEALDHLPSTWSGLARMKSIRDFLEEPDSPMP